MNQYNNQVGVKGEKIYKSKMKLKEKDNLMKIWIRHRNLCPHP